LDLILAEYGRRNIRCKREWHGQIFDDIGMMNTGIIQNNIDLPVGLLHNKDSKNSMNWVSFHGGNKRRKSPRSAFGSTAQLYELLYAHQLEAQSV